MPWWPWLAGLALLAIVAVLLVWLLKVTEGAYLGPGVVTALYDRFADQYDRIKQFDDADEAYFLGEPVARYLAQLEPAASLPWLLDVATGTGRFSLAVMRATQGHCQAVALDRSLGMLRQAQAKLDQAGWAGVIWLQHDAAPLPFGEGTFDVVACLEALEFMPDPRAAIAELLRVARPGALVAVTNRIGRDARLMPGKVFSRLELSDLLRSAGAGAVDIRPWQVDYDLALALKAGPSGELPEGTVWPGLLSCPICRADQPVAARDDQAMLTCSRCGWRLKIDDGVWRSAPSSDLRGCGKPRRSRSSSSLTE